MDELLIVVRFGLALVFIVAGVGKLLDPSGSRTALQDFGVPAKWTAAGGWLLPLVELAVAAALLIQPLARVGAAAAMLLLAAFAAVVASAVRQGRAPDCHCFGQLHSAPAGRGTIVRNVALALPAALVAVVGQGDALAGLSPEGTALIAVSALAAGLAVATAVLLRESRGVAPFIEAPAPLDVGEAAPELSLRDPQGAMLALADVIDGQRPTVLVFVTPECPACKDLVPRLERWRPVLAERVALVVIRASSFPPTAQEAAAGPHVLWDIDNASLAAYRLLGAPSAIQVDPAGVIASAPTLGGPAIEALIRVARLSRVESRGQAA